MKIETQQAKSIVAELRKIRDQISLEIQDMNSEQMLAYFNSKEGLFPKEVWQTSKEHKIGSEQSNFSSTKDGAAVVPPRKE